MTDAKGAVCFSDDEIGSLEIINFEFWGLTSTTINIVSIELQNSRDGLLAEVLILKTKCYRKEVHLLTYLTQPLSLSMVFVIGQEGLISVQILGMTAALRRLGHLPR